MPTTIPGYPGPLFLRAADAGVGTARRFHFGAVFLHLLFACLVVAGSAEAAETLTLRLGFETPRTDSQFIGAARLSELVRERSGGRLRIKLFPASVLGSGPAMLAEVREGNLDMYLGGSGYFANLAPRLNIVDIPFLFAGYRHADSALNGGVGDEMLAELEPFALKGLAFWENGFRCLTNNRGPVRSAEDVRGLRLRTLANPMHLEAWSLLGTTAIPLPLAELYTAIENGMVQGQEHPLNVTRSARLFEVQRHVSVTNHVYSPLILAINKKRFDAFPEDLRTMLIESAREAGAHQKQFIRENIARYLEEMEASGCEIIPAAAVDADSFVRAVGVRCRDVYLREYGGSAGKRWLEAIDAMSVRDH